MTVTIHPAVSDADMAAVRQLTLAYAQWLAEDHGVSLEFQGIETELSGLPGKYAPPRGALFVAWRQDAEDTARTAVGCIALRPFEGTTGEIKRLFVTPEGRVHGLGRRLCETIIQAARDLGYQRLILDTGADMTEAQILYEKFGFEDIEAYYHNPYPARFMGKNI